MWIAPRTPRNLRPMHDRQTPTPATPAATRSAPSAASAERNAVEQAVRRNERRLALCYVAVSLFFRSWIMLLAAGLVAWILYQVFLRRNPRVILLTISVGASLAALEIVGGRIIEYKLSRTIDFDIDHRMKPDPAAGVNSDGIRCPVESSDFSADTFNVICLGDSFVYGYALDDPAETWVCRVERALNEIRRPDAPRIRMINFGWTSSSPLLAKRLLYQVGVKYKPDLVIQCLDMTDFADDLVYRYELGRRSPSPLAYLARVSGVYDTVLQVRSEMRLRDWLPEPPADGGVPKDRFFILNQSLAESRPFLGEIEGNIRDIASFCGGELDCPFLLILMPRACQYSDRECPRSWEADKYRVLGPWVLEPFKWLEEFSKRVKFPCRSILKDFQETKVFPTCYDADPHWNAKGHQVAAGAIARVLRESGLVPVVAP